MKTKQRLLILSLFVLVCIATISVFIIYNSNHSDHEHQWGEWRVIQSATCESTGKQIRSCTCGAEEEASLPQINHIWNAGTVIEQETCSKEGRKVIVCTICGAENYQQIQKKEHNFTEFSEWSENSISYISSICEFCGEKSEVYNGIFFDEEKELYLIDREKNFSFDVLCDKGIEYIYQNVNVWNSFYTNLKYDETPELFEKYIVTNISGNRYRIHPSSSYKNNMTYSVSLPDDIKFAEYPTQSLSFSIEGNSGSEVEYRKDIVFLKQLEEDSPGYYPYELSYDNASTTYTLILSKQGIIDESYIGKVLCVGDCCNFEEANLQSPNTVIIGKISSMLTQDDNIVLKLSSPSLDEVYSKLNVNSGITDISSETLSVEQKNALSANLLSSDAFASAIATANLTAQAYASSYNFTARESALSIDNISFDIEVKTGTYPNGNVNPNQAVAVVLVIYKHSIPVQQNDVDLGSIDFDIEFNTTVTFTIDLYNNLEYYDWWDWDYKLYLDLALYQETKTEFNLSASLNLQYTYSSETYYIVNPNSGIIHSFDCRMCYNYKNDTACRNTYSQIISVPNYLDYECQICKPFTMDDSGFILNLDTKVLHCINCESAKHIAHNRILAFSMYPLGYNVNNCSNCNPQNHTKSLNDYLTESVQSSDWSVAFDLVKASIGDVLKGNGASPIDENTRPRLTLSVYCFEVPVFIEPNFDFDLNANFKFKYESSVMDVYMATLHYNMGKDEDGQTIGYEILTKTNHITSKTDFDLDLAGEARAELGIIVEFRFGLKYLSNFFYVGLNGEIGAYTELAGVLHANNYNENYYAARVEAGLYYESSLTYAISGILKPNSQTIIPKTDVPFYKSGDTKAYYAFADYDQKIILNGVNNKQLSDSLLKAVYYDLNSMTVQTGDLSWLGTEQYSISYRFADLSGKTIDYCYIENGILYVSDSAPANFEVIMYVNVVDNFIPQNFLDYVSTPNNDGFAFFLDDFTISITYYAEYTIDEEKIFGDYLKNTLIPQYGFFNSEQLATIGDPTQKWFKPQGIISASAFDYDMDNQKEMLMVYTEKYSYGFEIYMRMYEIQEGDIVLMDTIPFNTFNGSYPTRGIVLPENETGSNAISLSCVESNNRNLIVCTYDHSEGYFYEGMANALWILEYDGTEFDFVASYFTDYEGTSGHRDTVYTFKDGLLKSSELYYNSLIYYDPSEEEGIYENYKAALTAFWGKYGMTYDESNGQISSANNVINIYDFSTEVTNVDWDSYLVTFKAELLVGPYEIVVNTNQNPENNDLSNQQLINELYLEKIYEYEAQYNPITMGSYHGGYYSEYELSGVWYVDLLDFNNDGVLELLLCYFDQDNGHMYDIFTVKSGKLERILTKRAWVMQDPYCVQVLIGTNGEKYIADHYDPTWQYSTGAMYFPNLDGSWVSFDLWSYDGQIMSVKMTFMSEEYCNDPRFMLNGEFCSEGEYYASQESWFNDDLTYSPYLYNYSDYVIQIDFVKAQLGKK